jgi:hypothetical protein
MSVAFSDIVRDVQYYLQGSSPVQELVEPPYIGKDAAWVNGWIFDSNLKVAIENTQLCAVVVSYGGGWAAPQDDSTAEFPLIVVDIWADPTRADDHSVELEDAKTKCFAIHKAIKKALHFSQRVSPEGSSPLYFQNTRVTSSELLGEPALTPVLDGNGAMMLRCRYGVTTF